MNKGSIISLSENTWFNFSVLFSIYFCQLVECKEYRAFVSTNSFSGPVQSCLILRRDLLLCIWESRKK